MSWNVDGTLLATSSKDRLRVIDPRTNVVVKVRMSISFFFFLILC
jgi:hypothetical protein